MGYAGKKYRGVEVNLAECLEGLTEDFAQFKKQLASFSWEIYNDVPYINMYPSKGYYLQERIEKFIMSKPWPIEGYLEGRMGANEMLARMDEMMVEAYQYALAISPRFSHRLAEGNELGKRSRHYDETKKWPNPDYVQGITYSGWNVVTPTGKQFNALLYGR